jgi:hypothetical protein
MLFGNHLLSRKGNLTLEDLGYWNTALQFRGRYASFATNMPSTSPPNIRVIVRLPFNRPENPHPDPSRVCCAYSCSVNPSSTFIQLLTSLG